MEIALHKYTALIEDIQQKQEAVRIAYRAWHEGNAKFEIEKMTRGEG